MMIKLRNVSKNFNLLGNLFSIPTIFLSTDFLISYMILDFYLCKFLSLCFKCNGVKNNVSSSRDPLCLTWLEADNLLTFVIDDFELSNHSKNHSSNGILIAHINP